MPHLSRHPLSIKIEQEIIENLNLILSSITKAQEMLSFMGSLLTHTEKVMIAKRIAMIALIEQNFKDSEISKLLNVTEPTVAKFRIFYEARPEGFKVALKKLEEQKRLKAFKDALLELADFVAKSGSGHIKKTFG